MRKNPFSPNLVFPLFALVAALFTFSAPVFGAARFVIVNVDAPGEGFNDPTPAEPVGGNPGTTIGEQRLIAFQFAADLWGATLDSNVEIRVQASFDPLACTANSAALGAAGPLQVFRDFPGAEFPRTWYPVALANKRAGSDLAPGESGTSGDDIRAFFNSNLGQPDCLAGSGFYYGLNTNEPPGQFNLVVVLLHEFAHGLGFLSFVNIDPESPTFGTKLRGRDDIYIKYVLDTTTGKRYSEMTLRERRASLVNAGGVVWDGAEVTAAVPQVLSGVPLLTINSPAGIAGNYEAGAASFGPPLTPSGVTGNVVLADDGVDAGTDACTPLTNAEAISGNIALVDRGTCTFTVKVKNAQDAGAIGVIVADNVAGSPPPGLGGIDPTITIPSVRITLDDGNTIKAALANGETVNATLRIDPERFAGTDSQGRALLYTPNPAQPGSTLSHWDVSLFRNQLMEPFLNADLTFSVKPPEDLTLPLLRDIGWFLDADGDNLPDVVGIAPSQSGLTSTLMRASAPVARKR